MAYKGNITYDINFNVDKNNALQTLKLQLDEIAKLSDTQIKIDNPIIPQKSLHSVAQQARNAAAAVQVSLEKAFDTKTGVTNLQKLEDGLNKLSLPEVQQRFEAIGPKGQQAMLNISKSALTTNVQLKETVNLFDKLGQTFMNTIKWSISSSAINSFIGAIQQAYGYVQHLDTSLNDIRIVTGKSADEMERFAVNANDAAKQLGAATTDYTEASLIYYQQGLNDEEVKTRAETTLKAANVTGQSGRAVSEELTAVWNGYKVTAEETEQYVDKLAAVAATTASDLEELSIGMSKVAAAANSMGVDVDQLNAQLATIISTTRQAPETAGTALKTIYARMEDLKVSGEDEYGVKLGDVSSTLQQVGIEIIDTEGNLRDLGEVIEQVGNNWDNWTRAQQDAIAQSLAGKRQYNNLLALFDNWDKYNESLEVSKDSAGTLQKQQDIYMQSTSAHLQQLKTEWEDLYDSVLDTDDLNDVVDDLTKVLNLITNIIDQIGGGKTLLTGLFAFITTKGVKAISDTITPLIKNLRNSQDNAAILGQLKENIELQKEQGLLTSEAAEKMTQLQDQTSQYWGIMSEEQINASQNIIREIGDWETKRSVIASTTDELREYLKAVASSNVEIGKDLNSDNLLTFGTASNKNITNVLKEYATNAQSAQAGINDVAKRIEGLDYKIRAAAQSTTGADAQLKKLGRNELKGVRQSVLQAADAVEKLKYQAEKGLIPKEVYNTAKTNLADLKKLLKGVEDSLSKGETNSAFTKKVKDLIAQFNKLSTGLDDTNARYQKFLQLLQEGGMTEAQAKIALEQLEKELQEEDLALEKLVQDITKLIGSFASLYTSIQSLSSLGSIWEDKDLSSSEKLSQTMSSLVFILPMLASSVSSATESLQGFGASLSAAGVNAEIFSASVAGIPVIGIILTALTAIVAVCAIQYGKFKKELENVAEAAEENAKVQQEVIDKTKEEKEAVEELANSYNSLIEKKEEDIDFTKEQRDEIYELVKSYGDQRMIIQALAGDYDELSKSIQKAQSSANQTLQQELASGIEAQKHSMETSTWAKASVFERDKNKTAYDVSDLNNTGALLSLLALGSGYGQGVISTVVNKTYGQKSSREEAFGKELGTLIGKSGKNVIDTTSGAIDYDDLEKILLSDTEKLNKILEEYKDVGAAEKIEQLLSDNAEQIEAIKDYEEQLQEANLQQIGYEHLEDIQNQVTSLAEFEKQINILAQEALDKGYVETEEEGIEWAKEFIGGLSDEFSQFEQESYIADEILNNIVPSDEDVEDRLKAISLIKLKYTTNERTPLNDKTVPEVFDNLDAITDQEDLLNNQISLTEDEIDKIYKLVDEGSPTAQSYIASHIDMISALIKQGMTVEEVIENINADLEAATSTDHLITIEAIFNEDFKGKKFKEHIEELFADQTLDIGVDQSTFEHLSKTSQSILLDDLARQETEKVLSLSDQQIAKFEERKEYLEKELALEGEILASAQEELGHFETNQQQFLDDFSKNIDNQVQTLGISTEEQEQLKVEYQKTAEDALEAYTTAIENGEDGISAVFQTFRNSSQNIQDVFSLMFNNDPKAIEKFFKSYAEGTKKIETYTDKVSQSESKIQSYNNELKEIPPTQVDWNDRLAETRAAIDNVNDGIDDLQDSYATLQTAVEEYNEKGYVSMDTLQSLLTMDSSYLSSLEMINGQLTINNETYDNLIDAQIQLMKVQATELYMEELMAIANGEVVTKTQDMENANYKNVDSIQAVINKAKEGIGVLYEYADAEVTANLADGVTKDQTAIEEATKAYYNKLQLIESLANQTTENQLEKTSKSSSSSSSSEPDEEDYLERDEDLYRAINEELEDIESTLGRIQDIESHAWGKSAKVALEEENELLNKQIDLLEQKKDAYEENLSTQRKALEDQGVTFSDDGSIMTNAETRLDELYAEYNAMVDKYNAMTKDEQETYKDTLEAKKDEVEAIKDAMDDYEDAYNDYNSILDDLLDAHYDLIENAVNNFNATIDIQLELDEAKDQWNDFWYDVVKDVEDTDFGEKISKSLSKLDILTGVNGDSYKSQINQLTQHLNEVVDEVNKQIAGAEDGGGGSIFGDDTALSKETLETYRDNLIDAVTSAKEEIDNMTETYLDALDDAKDKLDEQIEGWEEIGDHIEHNIELIQMLAGEKEYEGLNKQYEQLYQNNLQLVQANKMNVDYWKERMFYYEQMMTTEEEGSTMYKMYADSLEKASENYKSAVEQLDSTVINALKNLQSWKENQINSLNDAFDKNLTGGIGVDDLEKEWDLAIKKQEFYLDNVERALEMEDLQNEFNDILNSMDLRNDKQQEFLKFQDEELAKLNEKEQLTQYDIDELKARLEIKKQELALEEAQRNKSNLRLRRDSQGNYTYQYTADEDQVEDTKEGLLSAKRSWYELVKKRQTEMADYTIGLVKDIQQALEDMETARDANDENAYNNAKARYETLCDFYKQAAGDTEKAKRDYYWGTAEFFSEVDNNTILPMWETTVERMIDKWSKDGENSFVGSTKNAVKELQNITEEYGRRTDEILDTAGVNFKDLVNNGIDPTTESLNEMQDSNEDLDESLMKTNNDLSDMEENLQLAVDAYEQLKDAAVQALEAANKSLETLANTAVKSVQQIETAVSAAQSAQSITNNNTSSNNNTSTSSTGTASTEAINSTQYRVYTDPSGVAGKYYLTDSKGNSILKFTSLEVIAEWLRKKGFHSSDTENGKIQWNASKKVSFKSGGYTGSWSEGIPGTENGRLAILHEKELVLNADDTKNLLSTVEALRDMTSSGFNIDSIASSIINAGAIQAQILSKVGSAVLQGIASMVSAANGDVQNYRNMTVNADFSGVRSADQIYQALMELDNYGSQQMYSTSPLANKKY